MGLKLDFNDLTRKAFQRKKFFVKPSLQLKYLLILVIVILLIGIAVFNLISLQISSSTVLENLSEIEIAKTKNLILQTVVYVIGIVIVIVFIEGIFFLHRLTGPLYVLEKMLKQLSEGDLTVKLKLRKGDELQDFAGKFQKMVDSLKNIVTEDKTKLDEIKIQMENIITNINNIPTSELKTKLTKVKMLLTELYSKFKT